MRLLATLRIADVLLPRIDRVKECIPRARGRARLILLYVEIHVQEAEECYVGREQVRSMYQDRVRSYADNGPPHTPHVTTNLPLDVSRHIDELVRTRTRRASDHHGSAHRQVPPTAAAD
ncbi:hypothetical protein [Streptomyces sp. NPDC002588]|uniref:hypothetical protein n=1 Tax=Streptomyces sp. NPDC002588 TaxID=3154419 RepID=UPI003322C86C